MATSTISLDKEVYSTSEQKIGTWVDGKTLYRKVFTGDSYSTPIPTNIPTSKIVKTECYILVNGYFDSPYYTDASDWWNYFIGKNSPYPITIRGSSLSGITKYITIIEYTKD